MTLAQRLAQLTDRLQTSLRGAGAGAERPSTLSGEQREDLVRLLNEGRPGQQWLAAEALGEADPGRAGLAALQAALASGDPILRQEAADALAHAGARRARPLLLESASGGVPAAQAAAADALGRLPADDESALALLALLDSDHAAVRQSAAEALARTGLPASRPRGPLLPDPAPRLLQMLAGDPDPMARRAAALALGKLGDARARPALLARQADPDEDWRVRETAALAVTRLREEPPAGDGGPAGGDDEPKSPAPGD